MRQAKARYVLVFVAFSGLCMASGVPVHDGDFVPVTAPYAALYNHMATDIIVRGKGLLPGIVMAEKVNRDELDPTLRSYTRQMLAMFYTFAGAYEQATEVYLDTSNRKSLAPSLAGKKTIEFEDAESAIVRMAKNRRAVFINENHGNPVTRVLPLALLQKLRQEGYNYVALEALIYKADGKKPDADSRCIDLADRDLCKRGYGLTGSDTGVYTKEPVYGLFLRSAIALGYRMVAYDIDDAPSEKERDLTMARRIAAVLEKDPSAKILVLGGFDHVAKEPDNMAYDFKKLTGIDPLSIDQVALLGVDRSAWGPAGEKLAGLNGAYVAMVDGAALSTRPGVMDVSVYRAPFDSRRGKGDWLGLGGLRIPVKFPVSWCQDYPCLLSARHATDVEAAVASDATLVTGPAETFLYLSPGSYTVTKQTGRGETFENLVVPRR